MTDRDKRRRIASRFMNDPVPPRTHRSKERKRDREQGKERR